VAAINVVVIGPIPDAHGTQSAHGDAAIDPIAIADHVARRFIPRESFRDLACNPFCRLGDLKPKLEQFAVNAWRAPKWVLDTHPPDQRAVPSRLAAVLPVDAISNASSAESRPCANARAYRAG
jgi:hypothetical protein